MTVKISGSLYCFITFKSQHSCFASELINEVSNLHLKVEKHK